MYYKINSTRSAEKNYSKCVTRLLVRFFQISVLTWEMYVKFTFYSLVVVPPCRLFALLLGGQI